MVNIIIIIIVMAILYTTNIPASEQSWSKYFCRDLVITQDFSRKPSYLLVLYILPGYSHLNLCTSYGRCPRDFCKTQNSLLGSRTVNAITF